MELRKLDWHSHVQTCGSAELNVMRNPARSHALRHLIRQINSGYPYQPCLTFG